MHILKCSVSAVCKYDAGTNYLCAGFCSAGMTLKPLNMSHRTYSADGTDNVVSMVAEMQQVDLKKIHRKL